jgi:hypothetical protein
VAPTFEHDCDDCLYLGSVVQEPTPIGWREGPHDLYVCFPQGTVIARHGDEGEDYYSGRGTVQPVLVEAERRASLELTHQVNEAYYAREKALDHDE